MKELSAKQVKVFFLVLLMAAILGALSSCTGCSRSGRLLETKKAQIVAPKEYIKYEDALALVESGVFKKLGDTTRMFATLEGTEKSALYKGTLYRYSKNDAVYVRLKY